MKMKKILALLLCIMLLLTGCGTAGGGAGSSPAADGSSAGGAQADPGGEVEEIVFATWTINTLPSDEAIQSVEDEINKITEDAIGVKVDYKVFPLGEFQQKVALELQSGGTIDVFSCRSNFQSNVVDGMCYDITELVDTYCKDAQEILPADWWDCAKFRGRLYGVPAYTPKALGVNIVWRSDIAEELKLDMSGVNTVEDLTEIFARVKEAHPEMYPLIGGNGGFGGLTSMTYAIPGVDTMGDSGSSPAGVLVGDSDTVVNLFETEEYRQQMMLVRSWYEKGYIMQDLATTTLTNIELLSSGNAFCNITLQGGGADYIATNAAGQTSQPLASKYIGACTMNTVNAMAQGMCVASTSKVPEASLKFMNLMFTNADLANLIQWGIEGRDYVVNEDGTVQPPEGFDSSSVPYPGGYFNMLNMYCGLEYPAAGTPQESINFGVDNIFKAERVRSFGFVFDTSSVTSQYAAVSNVIMQYYAGLDCGSVDLETTIPAFNQALKEAGIDDIIAEKQRQYDEWKAAQ